MLTFFIMFYIFLRMSFICFVLSSSCKRIAWASAIVFASFFPICSMTPLYHRLSNFLLVYSKCSYSCTLFKTDLICSTLKNFTCCTEGSPCWLSVFNASNSLHNFSNSAFCEAHIVLNFCSRLCHFLSGYLLLCYHGSCWHMFMQYAFHFVANMHTRVLHNVSLL